MNKTMLNPKLKNTRILLYYFKRAVEAVNLLHEEYNIAHCDVNPANFIIKDDYEPAVIDFGTVRKASDLSNGCCGTKGY